MTYKDFRPNTTLARRFTVPPIKVRCRPIAKFSACCEHIEYSLD